MNTNRAPISCAEPSPCSSPSEIRDSIDCVRSRMDETIDEIQKRLSPGYIKKQAVDKMKETGRKAGNSITNAVREHPIPVTIAGLGVGLLIGSIVKDRVSSSSKKKTCHTAAYDPYGDAMTPTSYPPPPYGEREEGWRDRASQMKESAKSRLSDATHQAREKASEVGHRVSEFGHKVGERASEMSHEMRVRAEHAAERVQHGVSQAADAVSHTARDAADTAARTYKDYPLLIGGAVFALGLTAGLLTPTTRREDEVIGRRRDTLLKKAKQYGGELAEKGKAVAGAAVEAARDEAKSQHLTPKGAKEAGKDVIERAKEVGRTSVQAAKSEARDQNLTSSSSGRSDTSSSAKPSASRPPVSSVAPSTRPGSTTTTNKDKADTRTRSDIGT